MMPRRLQIVDSLLDLDAHSPEPDDIRQRRAHLAKYAKAAVGAALVICVVAAARVGAAAVVGDDDASTKSAAATTSIESDSPKWAQPEATHAAPLLGINAIDGVAKAAALRVATRKKHR